MTGSLRFRAEAGIARLLFGNPRRVNAINAEMWQALPGLLARVAGDPSTRVLVGGLRHGCRPPPAGGASA